MNFKKKLKTRLYTAVALIATGIILILLNIFFKRENTFLSGYGLSLAVIGGVRVRNYLLITKSEESIRKQEIAETDERNISIANKAKSTAFIIYLFIICLVIIALSTMNIYPEFVKLLSVSIALLVLIYWVCYLIMQKKN